MIFVELFARKRTTTLAFVEKRVGQAAARETTACKGQSCRGRACVFSVTTREETAWLESQQTADAFSFFLPYRSPRGASRMHAPVCAPLAPPVDPRLPPGDPRRLAIVARAPPWSSSRFLAFLVAGLHAGSASSPPSKTTRSFFCGIRHGGDHHDDLHPRRARRVCRRFHCAGRRVAHHSSRPPAAAAAAAAGSVLGWRCRVLEPGTVGHASAPRALKAYKAALAAGEVPTVSKW